jgi:hypothetical protein
MAKSNAMYCVQFHGYKKPVNRVIRGSFLTNYIWMLFYSQRNSGCRIQSVLNPADQKFSAFIKPKVYYPVHNCQPSMLVLNLSIPSTSWYHTTFPQTPHQLCPLLVPLSYSSFQPKFTKVRKFSKCKVTLPQCLSTKPWRRTGEQK